MGESAASYFLKYAYPCAYVLCDQGRLSLEDHDYLQAAAQAGQDVPFEELERFFPAAFRRIREVAGLHGLDPHSLECIRRYFRQEHNSFIDAGDGTYADAPKEFCEFCKVRELEVLERKVVDGKLMLLVRRDPARWVHSPFMDDVEVGERVTVHHALAVERLD